MSDFQNHIVESIVNYKINVFMSCGVLVCNRSLKNVVGMYLEPALEFQWWLSRLHISARLSKSIQIGKQRLMTQILEKPCLGALVYASIVLHGLDFQVIVVLPLPWKIASLNVPWPAFLNSKIWLVIEMLIEVSLNFLFSQLGCCEINSFM